MFRKVFAAVKHIKEKLITPLYNFLTSFNSIVIMEPIIDFLDKIALEKTDQHFPEDSPHLAFVNNGFSNTSTGVSV